MQWSEGIPENIRPSGHVTLVEMHQTFFRTDDDGRVVNLAECSAADFDAFISTYLEIADVDRSAWPLLLRWRAVNFAVKNGQFLPLINVDQQTVLVDPLAKERTLDQTGVEKLDQTLSWLVTHPTGTDEELAAHLGLRRAGSARFWRLKARMLLEQNPKEGGQL